MAELESLFMRQSAVKEFLAFLARAVHNWKYGALFLLGFVSGSHTSCVGGVDCGILNIGFFGRFCCDSRAPVGSTLVTCSASVRDAFGRIAHNFHVDADSNPEVFFLRSHAEWRSVPSRCFSSQSRYASSHLEI